MSAYADCAGCGKRIRTQPKSHPEPMCRPCAIAAGRFRRGHGKGPLPHGSPGQYRDGCRCDVCRSAQSERSREYAARKKAETGKAPWQISEEKRAAEGRQRARGTYARACSQCGADYRTDDPRSKFCTHACYRLSRFGDAPKRPKSQRVPKSKALAQTEQYGFCWLPDRHPARASTTPSAGVLVSGVCADCGDSFTVRTFTGTARYCSEDCQSRSRRRRAGVFAPSPRLRREVYARDGYACRLCGDPTDTDADYLSDWYPSLDHIIPQSKWPAGKPGRDAADNLRTAHRWCNAVRGNGDYYDDEDLKAPVTH